jgi:hypothetical protein
MTVNDGLPLDEPVDPPTDMLPLGVVDAPTGTVTLTQPPAPAPPPDPTTEGSVEGDLFDGQDSTLPSPARAGRDLPASS